MTQEKEARNGEAEFGSGRMYMVDAGVGRAIWEFIKII